MASITTNLDASVTAKFPCMSLFMLSRVVYSTICWNGETDKIKITLDIKVYLNDEIFSISSNKIKAFKYSKSLLHFIECNLTEFVISL